jgi:hypothetical protein
LCDKQFYYALLRGSAVKFVLKAKYLLLTVIVITGCQVSSEISSVSSFFVKNEWSLEGYSFSFDDFLIEVNGKQYKAQSIPVKMEVSKGFESANTMLIWSENGDEMRLNMYFKSDGRFWWVDEIRTYDGNSPGEWVYYTGVFFKSPKGQAYVGDVTLISDLNKRNSTKSTLHFTNLRLECECAFQEAPETYKP